MTFEEEEQERRLDELFNHLVEEGALELLSIDPVTEEPLYRVTPKCKEIIPELYYEFKNEMDNAIFDLWQRDIIEYRFSETKDEDAVRLTGQGYLNYLQQADQLSDEQRRFITSLIDETELISSLDAELEAEMTEE